jgi:hypothetical protein
MQATLSDGVQRVFNFNFAGGYISQSDVKAYKYDPVTSVTTAVTLTPAMFTGTNQITLSAAIPSGQYFVIYRDTQKTTPLVDFTNGAIMNEANLDMMADQTIFVAAEMTDRFDTVNDGSTLALLNSADAQTKAATAITTANAATATANGAVTTANGATATANGAVTTANTAKSTADTAKSTADAATATANGIDAKATSALANANTAVTTANGIDTKATSALTQAGAAVTTANGAVTTANTALTTANGVDAKATSALSTAGTAQTNANTALSTANAAATTAGNAYQKSGGDVSGSILSTAPTFQYRSISGSYGVMWHQDNNNWYLLSTSPGDQRGTFNTFRPIMYSPSNGYLTLGGSGHGIGMGSDLNLNTASGGYSYSIRMNGGGYVPIIRASGNTSSVEFINSANTAVNFAVRDDGTAVHRNNVFVGGNGQVAGDGNLYGSAWGNDWLSNNLTNRFNAKQDSGNYVRAGSNYIQINWDGHLRGYVDGQHQGAFITDFTIQCNGANGKMNFDSCQQLGFASGNRDLPYFMNNGTYSWFVTQKNGSNTVNLPLRSNGYIEWTTDIGSVGCNYFTSDEFYKRNITPVAKPFMEDVEKMEFVSFDYAPGYNSGEHWKLGVTSQQLASIDPDYVHTLSDQTQTPDTSRLLILALRTIQELNDRVKALEAVSK